MTQLENLKTAYEAADKAAVAATAKYELDRQKALDDVKAKQGPKLEELTAASVTAQKAYCDREALEELLGRDDQAAAKVLADQLGLPTDEFA